MRTGADGRVPVLLDGAYTLDGTAGLDGYVSSSALDASRTLLSQYANSPTIVAIINDFNAWLDPGADIDNFYATVWNVQTAVGFGLDYWGRIVNIPRQITIVDLPRYLGFNEGQPGYYPFNQAPFYSGNATSSVYLLSDDAYRVLIMTKALANISSFTAPSVNALLRYLFAGRGSCYVLELSPMQIEYVFNFPLQSWEAAVLLQPSLMPRPAGVGVTITVNA